MNHVETKTMLIDTTSNLNFELSKRFENTAFSRAKIYVMYHGYNPNGSYISKEAVERNIASIKNIPIVGEFNTDTANFKGHGGKVEFKDDILSYIETTKPFGVVPESANIYWEEKDNQEYLVVDDVYIWNRYYDEVKALKDSEFGQSMEIEVINSHVSEDYNTLFIDDFSFSALCILGIEKNGDERIQPAFDGAKIITYSKINLGDTIEMRDMLKDFKLSFQMDIQEEGGKNSMSKEKDIKFEDEEVLIQNEEELLDVEEKDESDENKKELESVDNVKRKLEEIIVVLDEVLAQDETEDGVIVDEFKLEKPSIEKIQDCLVKIEDATKELSSIINDTEDFELEENIEEKDIEKVEDEAVETIEEEEVVAEENDEIEKEDKEVEEIIEELEENSQTDNASFEEQIDIEKDELRHRIAELEKELRNVFIEKAEEKIQSFKLEYGFTDEDVSTIELDSLETIEELEVQLYTLIGKKVAEEGRFQNKSFEKSTKIYLDSPNEASKSSSEKIYSEIIRNVVANKKKQY